MTYSPLQTRIIQHGDVLEKLGKYPDNTFDTVISSPPYWALRDYGIDGQWGLESDFHDYLRIMQDLMKELKRVLKSTGTTWINIGDTYSGSGKGEIQTKSRYGIPDRFYTQCIDNGWIARNVIPWIKWNAMPTSVTDRLTTKWEYVYFFSKEQKYYFNLQNIKIPVNNDWKSVKAHISSTNDSKYVQQTFEGLEDIEINDDSNSDNKQDNTLGPDGKPKLTYAGFNKRYTKKQKMLLEMEKVTSRGYTGLSRKSLNIPGQTTQGFADHNGYTNSDGSLIGNGQTKNPGDLFFDTFSDEELLEWIRLCRADHMAWELAPPDLFFINPKPLPDAHFASFPVALPERILKCACPKETCIKCGRPRFPIIKPSEDYQKLLDHNQETNAYIRDDTMNIGLQAFKKGSSQPKL